MSKETRAAAHAAAKRVAQTADQVVSETKRLEAARAALVKATEALHAVDPNDEGAFQKHASRHHEAGARVAVFEARVSAATRAADEARKAADVADIAAEEAEVAEMKAELTALNNAIMSAVGAAREFVVEKLKVFQRLVDECNRRDRALALRKTGVDEGWRWPSYYGCLTADLSPEAADPLGRLESRILRNSY